MISELLRKATNLKIQENLVPSAKQGGWNQEKKAAGPVVGSAGALSKIVSGDVPASPAPACGRTRTRRPGPGVMTALAVALGCVAAGLDQPANATQDPGKDNEPGPEVLNRGPIHEAFASPITYDPATGPVVPKQPPDPIEEQPPEEKPDGDTVQWICGYWSWDQSAPISSGSAGSGAEPPPNCQWTPGYWDQCDGGWRSTCGCWTPVDQGTCQYLPAPPPSVEQGPSSPPPTENCNCSWTPGYWSWHEATETGAAGMSGVRVAG